jgi:type II secretory pathway pseudopilin PulG
MMRTSHHNRGFSLVEVLVYLSVMVLVAGGLITTFLSLDTVFLRNRTDRELMVSASMTLEQMTRAIRNAESINLAGSSFNTSPGALSLTTGATTTRFFISGGGIAVSVNGVELGPLTSDDVTVESLIFTHYIGTTTELVRVELTLSATSSVASSTRAFYTSAVLRGTYE